jgi:hypothetical protein
MHTIDNKQLSFNLLQIEFIPPEEDDVIQGAS